MVQSGLLAQFLALGCCLFLASKKERKKERFAPPVQRRGAAAPRRVACRGGSRTCCAAAEASGWPAAKGLAGARWAAFLPSPSLQHGGSRQGSCSSGLQRAGKPAILLFFILGPPLLVVGRILRLRVKLLLLCCGCGLRAIEAPITCSSTCLRRRRTAAAHASAAAYPRRPYRRAARFGRSG